MYGVQETSNKGLKNRYASYDSEMACLRHLTEAHAYSFFSLPRKSRHLDSHLLADILLTGTGTPIEPLLFL